MSLRTIFNASACIIMLNCVSGCASLTGYPVDPINSEADLAAFRGFSGPDQVALYFQTMDPLQRQALRNEIVYARLAAYDIEFQIFQASLNKESNLENLSGDFAVLVLNGLGATTGGAATKAALAAASAGVVGATAAINKDVFFRQALPAVLAQMSASRTAQLTSIVLGLQLPDAQYPLPRALLDVNLYQQAGSLPSAINILTATAGAEKTKMKAKQMAVELALLTGPRVQRHALLSHPRTVTAPAALAPFQPDDSFFQNLP